MDTVCKFIKKDNTNCKLKVKIEGYCTRHYKIYKNKEIQNIDTIYVDGCYNKSTGDYGWASITDSNGNDLICKNLQLFNEFILLDVNTPKGGYKIIQSKFNDVKSQQINGAELLAMVGGLKLALKHGIKKICSDSNLIVNWWSQNKVNPHTKKKMDNDKIKYIEQCYLLRNQFIQEGGEIIKISGDNNPADLGYHK